MRSSTHLAAARLTAMALFLFVGSAVHLVHAQPIPGEDFGKKSFEELKAALMKEPGAQHVINALRKKGDKRAIPILKEALPKVADRESRQQIARALIGLGDKDDAGWPILEKYALETIESDMPMPLLLDDKGQIIRGKPNPAFLAWCKKNNVDPNAGFEQYVYKSQGDIELIAEVGDKRAIPLLMKALNSSNIYAASRAAMGLARRQHKDAIKPMLAICEKAHPEVAASVAEALAFFDDPRAQAAAEKFIKSKAILESRRKEAKEKGFLK